MNRTKLGLKKDELHLKDNKKPINSISPNPKTDIVSRFMHVLGLKSTGIEDLSHPERRRLCNEAQISKEIITGTAMTYLRKDR